MATVSFPVKCFGPFLGDRDGGFVPVLTTGRLIFSVQKVKATWPRQIRRAVLSVFKVYGLLGDFRAECVFMVIPCEAVGFPPPGFTQG